MSITSIEGLDAVAVGASIEVQVDRTTQQWRRTESGWTRDGVGIESRHLSGAIAEGKVSLRTAVLPGDWLAYRSSHYYVVTVDADESGGHLYRMAQFSGDSYVGIIVQGEQWMETMQRRRSGQPDWMNGTTAGLIASLAHTERVNMTNAEALADAREKAAGYHALVRAVRGHASRVSDTSLANLLDGLGVEPGHRVEASVRIAGTTALNMAYETVADSFAMVPEGFAVDSVNYTVGWHVDLVLPLIADAPHDCVCSQVTAVLVADHLPEPCDDYAWTTSCKNDEPF